MRRTPAACQRLRHGWRAGVPLVVKRQFLEPVPEPAAEVAEQGHHVAPDQRLAAGDAQLGDAEGG